MALFKEIALQVVRDRTLGFTTKETAERFNTSERTIRRALQWGNKTFTKTEPTTEAVVEVEPEEYVPDNLDNVEMKYVVMASESSITINYGDESETITKSDDKFEQVSDIVWEGRGSQAALAEAYRMMSYKQEFIQLTDGMVEVDSAKGVVMYDGCQISPALADRIIEACQEGDRGTLNGLVAFTKHLHDNPSRRAVMELYSFLTAADILIREDGMVECYKRVKNNYYDFYTGQTRNMPGDKPKMHRWQVDEDQNRTCSEGYHVCAKSYLPSYHGGDGRVVKCLVHPADFVAIPVDYNYAKARVWTYEVIAEVTDY